MAAAAAPAYRFRPGLSFCLASLSVLKICKPNKVFSSSCFWPYFAGRMKALAGGFGVEGRKRRHRVPSHEVNDWWTLTGKQMGGCGATGELGFNMLIEMPVRQLNTDG